MKPWRRHRSGLWLPTERPSLAATLDRSHPLAKGLVGAWIFNEGGGRTVYDLCGRSNGIVTGATWLGRGLSFDGTGDYARLTGAPINNQSWAGGITVVWYGKTGPLSVAYPQFVSQDDYLTNSGGFCLGAQQSEAYRMRFSGNNGSYQNLIPITSGASLAANTTYVLAATFDNDIGKGYINGKLDKTGDPSNGTLVTAQEINFMACKQGTSYQTAGDVYAVFIYARPLLAAEIARLSAEPYAMFLDQLRDQWFPYPNWSGIVFSNRTPASGATGVPERTPISCDIMDNFFTFNNADIKITVKGHQYTNLDPEVSYQAIYQGVRITWTPSTSYEYGRGGTVAVRVDARNSHGDDSFTEWSFTIKYYLSLKDAQSGFFYSRPAERMAPLLVIFRQTSQQPGQLSCFFRRAGGGIAQLITAIRYGLPGTGECEPTTFICEMKRIQGQGSGNVADVEVLAGEASANMYGQYLLITGGDANIQAFQIFAAPTGSGDIQVTLVWEGQGDANVGVPVRIGGEGSAQIFRVEGITFIRINALPAAIRQALQDAGIIINP